MHFLRKSKKFYLIVGILKEFFVFPFAYLLSLLFFWPQSAKNKKNRPIVLLHGYLNSRSVWIYHKKRLELENFGPVYIMNLGFPWLSIEDFAKRLEKELLKIFEKTKYSEVIVVGHSMGGLVASYYQKHLAQKVKISHLITLGTPFQGTQMAKFGFGKCAKEMLPTSDFIKKIYPWIQNEKNFQLFSFLSLMDHIVIPHQNAEAGKIVKKYPDIGHGSMLFSKEVNKDLIALLKKITESESFFHG